MFNSITGTITAKLPKQIFIESNGIEWDICIPDTNLDMLSPVGSVAKIYTYLQHTDQLMLLFGFANASERQIFFDLMKVEGIGPKAAIKIMSSVSSSQLMEILDSGDLARLEKIPGVGKKTAGKMLLALKGKLNLQENQTTIKIPKNNPYNDVVISLVNMGYEKSTIEEKLSIILKEFEESADFLAKSQKEKEEIIFRRIIVELA